MPALDAARRPQAVDLLSQSAAAAGAADCQELPADAGLPLAATGRHPADITNAQTNFGKDREATDTLLTIERRARTGWGVKPAI